MSAPVEAPPGYVFGDSHDEARRLELLARAFRQSSVEWLAQLVEDPPDRAADLGCGTGQTTRMLAAITRARSVVGVDGSPTHLDRARRLSARGLEFRLGDLRDAPVPGGPFDFAYARLVLAHLPGPAAVAAGWCRSLRPGGTLVLEEIESVRTDVPAFRRHLELVAAVVALGGAEMYAGRRLARLETETPLRLRRRRIRAVPVATALAARLFLLSHGSWGRRALDAGLADEAELAGLRDELTALTSTREDGRITWAMHQAVFRAAAGSGSPA